MFIMGLSFFSPFAHATEAGGEVKTNFQKQNTTFLPGVPKAEQGAAEDEDFYYLQNGDLYPIEKGICKDILNSNKLSRSIDFEYIKEKVVFPYNDENRPKALEEDFLKNEFPEAYKYLKKKSNK